jgi:hypothetical protein
MDIRAEFTGASLGDKRLNDRVEFLSVIFEKQHGESISKSCQDWKICKAAYRFFDNSRFNEEAVIRPHYERTRDRISRLGEKVLVVHDTSALIYTHHKKTGGLGYIAQGTEVKARTRA